MSKTIAIVFVAVCLTIWRGVYVEANDKTPEQFFKEAKAQIREVPIAEVKKMIDAAENVIILDVRDKQEFEEGRIPGAINISHGMLEFKAAMIIPDKNAH